DIRQLGVPVGREHFLPGLVERRAPEIRKVLHARRVGVADPHHVVLLSYPVCAQGHMPVRRAEDDRLGLVHVREPLRRRTPSASSLARKAWLCPTTVHSLEPAKAPGARSSASLCDGWGSESKRTQRACRSRGPVAISSPLRSVAEIGCRKQVTERAPTCQPWIRRGSADPPHCATWCSLSRLHPAHTQTARRRKR